MIYLNSFDENNDVHPLPINIPPATRIFNASTPGISTLSLLSTFLQELNSLAII